MASDATDQENDHKIKDRVPPEDRRLHPCGGCGTWSKAKTKQRPCYYCEW